MRKEDLLANRYEILDRIKRNVFRGRNILSNEQVIIKMERTDEEIKLLKHESMIYYYLKNVKGFLPIKWFGGTEKYLYLVLPHQPFSLSEVIRKGKLTSTRIRDLMKKCIIAVKQLHEKEILHRDLKPDNILLDENDHVYIIDFGFAKKYMIQMHHIPFKTNKSNILGTPNYISIHVHEKNEPGRRDDMESLGYIWLHMLLGYLPWETLVDVLECKKKFIVSQQQNVEILKIQTYLKYCHALSFEAVPNYKL
jgi:serine/threonine protein kinase